MASEITQSSDKVVGSCDGDFDSSIPQLLLILRRIDAKLDSLIDDLEDFKEEENASGDDEDLPETESDEDVTPKKKKKNNSHCTQKTDKYTRAAVSLWIQSGKDFKRTFRISALQE